MKTCVVFGCRRIGHYEDPGRQPRISLNNRSRRTLKSSQNVRTRRDREFLEPAYVFAGYDEQTIEIGPTDDDGVVADVNGNVGVFTERPVAGHRLRNCATAAFRFDGDALSEKP